jgi:hypothetical protein
MSRAAASEPLFAPWSLRRAGACGARERCLSRDRVMRRVSEEQVNLGVLHTYIVVGARVVRGSPLALTIRPRL